MNLLALDLSLTSTGWAAVAGPHPVASGTFDPKGKGAARLQSAVTWLDKLFDIWQPRFVLIEGYSFGSRTSRAHAIGELGGVIRLRLYQRSAIIVELAPKVRAKLATGKGNAAKAEVLAAAFKRLGYGGHSFDEADALWILQAGLMRYALPGAIRVPATHLAALEGVDWPPAPLARAS